MNNTQQSEYSEASYETRIIAYADILGWRRAVTDIAQFQRLYEVLTYIANYVRGLTSNMKKTMTAYRSLFNYEEYTAIEFSFFSDCFAVSAPAEHGRRVFGILSRATDKLLHKGFLVRGGVALGELYHRGTIIFGPAFLKAVEIEQKEAIYPRFLCTNNLLEHLNQMQYRNEVLLQDCCQEWVVNIACGTLFNRDHLMKVIKQEIENESNKRDRYARMWRYMETMLPMMYELKSKNVSEHAGH